jgi:hypothetical protein
VLIDAAGGLRLCEPAPGNRNASNTTLEVAP